jgi:hypothetical protein
MTDLLAAMDEAAAALLKRVGLGGTTESEPSGDTTVREQVSVFDSVVTYVQWREKTKEPPKPDPSKQPGAKFNRLKGEFHGEAVGRSNRRSKAGNGHADPGEPAVDPA